jgi:hypothetical protein
VDATINMTTGAIGAGTRPAAGPTFPGAGDPRLDLVRANLRAAEGQMSGIRRRDSAAIVVGIAATSVATVLAGVPAATEQFLAGGWQLTCAITAGLTATATITTTLRQQFGSPDRLMRAATLVARLRALEFALTVRGISPAEADVEFQRVIEQFPEFDHRSA